LRLGFGFGFRILGRVTRTLR